MINTKGPQTNLTFSDRLFLWSVLIIILLLFLGWLGIFLGDIKAAFSTFLILIIFMSCGGLARKWLISMTKNVDDSDLCNWGYIFIAILAFAIGAIAYFLGNNSFSNKSAMFATYALGIFILNGIITVTMQGLLKRDKKRSRMDSKISQREDQARGPSKEDQHADRQPAPVNDESALALIEKLKQSDDPEDYRDALGLEVLMKHKRPK